MFPVVLNKIKPSIVQSCQIVVISVNYKKVNKIIVYVSYLCSILRKFSKILILLLLPEFTNVIWFKYHQDRVKTANDGWA